MLKRKAPKDRNWRRVWQLLEHGKLPWVHRLFGLVLALGYWLRCDRADEKPDDAPEHLWIIWSSMMMIENSPFWEGFTDDPVQYFQRFLTVREICKSLQKDINDELCHARDVYDAREVPRISELYPYAVAIARETFEEMTADIERNPFVSNPSRYRPDFGIFPYLKVPE